MVLFGHQAGQPPGASYSSVAQLLCILWWQLPGSCLHVVPLFHSVVALTLTPVGHGQRHDWLCCSFPQDIIARVFLGPLPRLTLLPAHELKTDVDFDPEVAAVHADINANR